MAEANNDRISKSEFLSASAGNIVLNIMAEGGIDDLGFKTYTFCGE